MEYTVLHSGRRRAVRLRRPKIKPIGPHKESSNARRPAQRQAQNRTAPAAQNQALWGPTRKAALCVALHRGRRKAVRPRRPPIKPGGPAGKESMRVALHRGRRKAVRPRRPRSSREARQGKQQCSPLCTAAGAEPCGLGGPRSSPWGPARKAAMRVALHSGRRKAVRPRRPKIKPGGPAGKKAMLTALHSGRRRVARSRRPKIKPIEPHKESSNVRRPAQRQAQRRAAAAVQNQAGRPGGKNSSARRLAARTKSRRREGLPLPARAQAG